MNKLYRNFISQIAMSALLSHCVGVSYGADDQDRGQAPIVAVVASDSFAEIRQQFAWVGGLIGIPVLGGLPDTYAMMATGGKGLQGASWGRSTVGELVWRDEAIFVAEESGSGRRSGKKRP